MSQSINDLYQKQNVLEVFQSGLKSLHSTESALLKGFNYILLATDDNMFLCF